MPLGVLASERLFSQDVVAARDGVPRGMTGHTRAVYRHDVACPGEVHRPRGWPGRTFQPVVRGNGCACGQVFLSQGRQGIRREVSRGMCRFARWTRFRSMPRGIVPHVQSPVSGHHGQAEEPSSVILRWGQVPMDLEARASHAPESVVINPGQPLRETYEKLSDP